MAKIIYKAICSNCEKEIEGHIKVTQYTNKKSNSGYIEIEPFYCKNCKVQFDSIILPFKEELIDV